MKASGKQIAARYVKALFDIASESKAVPAVEADLQALSALYDGSDIFRTALVSPLLSRGQQQKIMEITLTTTKAHKVTQQFFQLLSRQKRLAIVPEIAALFAARATVARGEIAVDLVSAVAMNAKDIADISTRLSKAYGKKIVLKTHVNPQLLGGAVVKIGSQQLDSSLAGKIRRLGHKLKAA